jgi:hypothetical protein
VTSNVASLLDKVSGSGCILVGDKGELFSVKAIPQTIPRNLFKGGTDERQHLEWEGPKMRAKNAPEAS